MLQMHYWLLNLDEWHLCFAQMAKRMILASSWRAVMLNIWSWQKYIKLFFFFPYMTFTNNPFSIFDSVGSNEHQVLQAHRFK